jgi:hypothetical protein
MPRAISPLVLEAQPDARGFGLPRGCELELPIRHATLPGPLVRFSAAKTALEELAIAAGSEAGPTVERAGVVKLLDSSVVPLPWLELDRPPLFERASGGWLSLWVSEIDGPERAGFLHYQGVEREIMKGDQLELVDALCRGERCAILSTLGRPTIASGATLLAGPPSGALARTDIEADPTRAFRPLAISALAPDSTLVALETRGAVALHRVRGNRSEQLKELPAPFGAWGVVGSDPALAILPGASLETPCTEDVFPIDVHAENAESPLRVEVQARPESVIVRSLGKGAIIGWVAPVSCRQLERTIVHLLLVGSDGRAIGSPMSVADATGFALATDGERLSLWLRTERGLSWIRGRCSGRGKVRP